MTMPPNDRRKLLGRDMAMIFQEPMTSLNPVHTVGFQIVEALRAHRKLSDKKAREEAIEALNKVRMPAPKQRFDEYPHQLSGGQKARIGIARAIACRPKLLVLDEPTAALDVSVQAVVLQLLERLRREDNLAFLFVSHDLNVVRMMCQRTIVLRNGAIVEQGESHALFDNPQTDYTRELVNAVPHIEMIAAERASA
eukprot:gene4087-biopygen3358